MDMNLIMISKMRWVKQTTIYDVNVLVNSNGVSVCLALGHVILYPHWSKILVSTF